MNPMPSRMHALPDHASSPPAAPLGTSASLRFRERVRARIGTAELLAFRVGSERFAFDVRALDEAIDTPTIDRLPLDPGALDRRALDPRALAHASDVDADAAPTRTATGLASLPGRVLLLGLMRVAGRSVPVFDTGRILGVRDAGAGTQALVMRSGTRRIALLADEVDDVIRIDLGTIQPPPVDPGDDLLLGVTWDGENLTGILDARALIQACQQGTTECVA